MAEQHSRSSGLSKGVPLVSIGLPVFNGQNYLSKSIDSILNQSFQDFELIISDNCSTDDTENICREYEKKSEKIRYYRQDVNLGASANFEFAFSKSRGKYFKWQAHDDICYQEFLQECVSRMEANPDSVLCQSDVAIIDEDGCRTNGYSHHDFGTTDPDPIKRFSGRLRSEWIVEVFGLIRRDTLERTERLGPFASHDRCLLANLALLGPFLHVPRELYAFRNHPLQFSQAVPSNRAMGWFDPNRADWPELRRWTVIGHSIRYLNNVELGRWARLRGYGALVLAQFYRRSWRKLIKETALAMFFGLRILGRKLSLR